MRRKTRTVSVGGVKIGGDSPMSIQSMTNTDTRDAEATIAQIKALALAGCDIVRMAIPDKTAAEAIGEIKARVNVPLVADIHFDHNLALIAMDQGIDKLRINPGNIGDRDKIKAVVSKAKEKRTPIRIGVNAGSLEQDILKKHGKLTAEALVESARRHIAYLEAEDFTDIIVSMKASDVILTIEAYTLFSKQFDYPLHLGITEAGLPQSSAIKSALGIGHLLYKGIGDTLRVSVTADPILEIDIAKDILGNLSLLPEEKRGIEVIACPTCGRTEINLIEIAQQVKDQVSDIKKNLKVAVMGCIVNGPGEGKAADIGIAGGNGKAVLFKRGKIIKTVPETAVVDVLVDEIKKM